jgi:hypothetical protein
MSVFFTRSVTAPYAVLAHELAMLFIYDGLVEQ